MRKKYICKNKSTRKTTTNDSSKLTDGGQQGTLLTITHTCKHVYVCKKRIKRNGFKSARKCNLGIYKHFRNTNAHLLIFRVI